MFEPVLILRAATLSTFKTTFLMSTAIWQSKVALKVNDLAYKVNQQNTLSRSTYTTKSLFFSFLVPFFRIPIILKQYTPICKHFFFFNFQFDYILIKILTNYIVSNTIDINTEVHLNVSQNSFCIKCHKRYNGILPIPYIGTTPPKKKKTLPS